MSSEILSDRSRKQRFTDNELIIVGILNSLDILMPTISGRFAHTFDTTVSYNNREYSFITNDVLPHLLLGMLGGDEGRGIFAEVLLEELERLNASEMVIAGRLGVRMTAQQHIRQFELSTQRHR